MRRPNKPWPPQQSTLIHSNRETIKPPTRLATRDPRPATDGIDPHLEDCCDLIKLKNSARVLSLRLNAPSMADVMVVAPGFCTPRIVIHWWLR